jgi:hypothetical protein
MPELEPGMLREILARLAEIGVQRARTGLEELGAAVQAQARITAHNGEHAWGTPTPASPGEGPAKISGTLLDSIGQDPVLPSAEGWSVRVGPRKGYYPPYSARWRSRVDSSRYGYYLETGDHGITYPWLGPAADKVGKASGAVAFARVFNDTSWTAGL